MPDAIAVVEPLGYDAAGETPLPALHVPRAGRGQRPDRRRAAPAMGVAPGTRLALLVRPGIDFISLVFALFKAGAVAILIDPGMGRRICPLPGRGRAGGFVAIPLVHAVRTLLRGRFPKARFNVTVGRRWFWGGTTLDAAPPPPVDRQRIGPDRGRRSGGDHLHHRQHRPAQGRALQPRQFRRPGRPDPRLLRHPARARSICRAFRCSGCSTARWA